MVEAQSRFASTDSISRLLAPGLAGVLIQWLTAPLAIVVNGLTFFVSAWNIGRVTMREAPPPRSDRHPLHDVREGFSFIWHHPLLRALAWVAGAWHLLFYGYTALLVLFATRELGMDAGMLGLAQMLGGAGVFVSSLLLRPLNHRYGPGITIIIGTTSMALGFVLMPMLPGHARFSAAAYAALVFFFDLGAMLFFVPYQALRQKVTPDEMLGRMISTMRFLTVAVAPLGALAAGYVGDHLGVRPALYCVAVGGVLLAAGAIGSRSIRSVRP
jgi:predicted MFS family arabinose efflux permease